MRSLELLFVVALVLYTTVIWTHKLRRCLKPWMVVVFGIALIADTVATVIVCNLVDPSSWKLNLAEFSGTFHIVTGLVSLLIMALHFSWALGALTVHGKLEQYFNKYSVYAWLLWLVALFSGIPLG